MRPHRPLAQRGVAVERRRDSVAADDAHHQPRAGAGVAEIERFARREQRAEPGAPNLHRPGAEPLDRRAERLASLAGPQHVVALEQPFDLRLAALSRPKRKARCEIDLSPGGRNAPFERPRAHRRAGARLRP